MDNVFLQLRRVLEDPELTPLDKNIFTALVTFAGGGKIFPRREQICKRVGKRREPTITKGLKNLRERGYIRIHRRMSKSSLYEICGVTAIQTKTECKAAEVNFPKC